jgi:hypothetical protein
VTSEAASPGGIVRVALATLTLLVVATIVGIVGLEVGELVPDRIVAERLLEARVDGTLSATAQEPTRLGGLADHFTECITVSVGLGEAADAGFLETLAAGTHLGPCDRLISALDGFGVNGRLPEGAAYLRYWHGTSALFRPIIALSSLATLRLLAFGALLATTALLARQVRAVAGGPAALGLLGPLIITTDYPELVGVAHHAVALTVALGGASLALAVSTRGPSVERVWFSAVLAGAAFVYVDLLTIVPGAWLLPAAMTMLAARVAGATAPRLLRLGVVSGVGWFVGYAGMWLGKWVFAAAVLGGRRVRDDVRSTIEERINGESRFSEPRFGAAISDNVDFWLDRPLARLVVLAGVIVIAVAIRRIVRTGGSAGLTPAAIAAGPALVPIVWFEILSNHSQIHNWFTYRSQPIAFGVVLLAVLTPNPGRAVGGVPVA